MKLNRQIKENVFTLDLGSIYIIPYQLAVQVVFLKM